MKLARRDVPRWLSQVNSDIAAILVFGEERGSVAETAQMIAAVLVPDVSDPFQVAQLEAEDLKSDPARLHDEFLSLSPLGGAKLIRVRDVTDRHLDSIQPLITLERDARTSNRMLLEAAELSYKSPIRRLFEGERRLVIIDCGADAIADSESFVRDCAKKQNQPIDEDAITILVNRIGRDLSLLRSAFDLLSLYKMSDPKKAITATDVLMCTGEIQQIDIDAVLDAVQSGQRAAIDGAVTRALEGGASAIALLRSAIRLFQRLHFVSSLIAAGNSPAAAIARLAPPVAYHARNDFLKACAIWPASVCARALARLDDAEARCKTTGLPEMAIASQALLRLPELIKR